MRVAVCALTYMRPRGLRRLLDSLVALDVPAGVETSIVIVDNDPERSAAETVATAVERTGHDIGYVNEPRRGISTARNAGVAAARDQGATYICFIDDDEWPEPDWLAELLDTRQRTGADVVTGPVLPVFEEEPPGWVVEGGFFERPRYPHDSSLGYATTSSVLIDMSVLADRPEPFDVEFGMTGGSDTHLFAQLVDDGASIAWCDTAVVYEEIPASRVDTGWILRREYRRGQTLSRSLRRRGPTTVRILRRLANGLLQLLAGLARTVVGAVRGRAAVLNGVKQVVFGAGMLTGLAGRRYEEYRTVHGT